MELFLLFVVIILLIIFDASKTSRLKVLEQRLSAIENYLKSLQLGQQKAPVQKPETKPEAEPVKTVLPPDIKLSPPKTEEKPPVVEQEKIIPPVAEVKPVTEEKKVNLPPPVPQQQVQAQSKPQPRPAPQEDWYDKFRKNNPDLEKFIGENILSKIAIVILVLGIAFFVKYAIDKDWINEIARVGIGILCGGIVLGFAHRLHKRFKAFSSVLVAGGIAIFYFTIGIGFHQYHIFNQTAAFSIMLLITAFSVFISVGYNRIELAALSIIGGFATPFMVSTGQGNYQVLFVYILILDAGMLVLAYLRKWNLINILAYGFTMLLYFSWLETHVIGKPGAPYAGAFIFGAIFYVVFVLMNMVNNIKERRSFGSIELSILISNTFLFYGAGMQILLNYHPEAKGIFSIGMALFNLVCSWLLYKRFKADMKLVYLMIGLTLTFITLVAPVQLHGNYITLFWALEAVLLMWLAQKSGFVLYRFVSVIITLLMLISLLADWIAIYIRQEDELAMVLLNKAFVTGFTAALSLLATALLLRRENEKLSYLGVSFYPQAYGAVLKTGFVVLLYLTGLFELVYQLQQRMSGAAAMAILIQAYHLLFVSALNLAAGAAKIKTWLSLYVLDFISCLVFIIGFALLPLFDFKEHLVVPYKNHTGFIFHYVSIGCFVFLLYRMRHMLRSPNPPVKNNLPLNTVLIAAGLTYLLSIELVLHLLVFTLAPAAAGSAAIYAKLSEYSIACTHVVKIGFPVLWGLLAFAYLFIGMKKQNKTLRILALVLIAITLLKLFTYDIQHASEAGKIIAFILLGIVLLVISFMYQKIKALLIDDEKTTAERNETQP